MVNYRQSKTAAEGLTEEGPNIVPANTASDAPMLDRPDEVPISGPHDVPAGIWKAWSAAVDNGEIPADSWLVKVFNDIVNGSTTVSRDSLLFDLETCDSTLPPAMAAALRDYGVHGK